MLLYYFTVKDYFLFILHFQVLGHLRRNTWDLSGERYLNGRMVGRNKGHFYFLHQDDKQAVGFPSQVLLRDQIALLFHSSLFYCILT